MTRKVIICAALALLAPSVKAADQLLPALPGMETAMSAPAAEADIQRPDSQKVLADLSADLRLSTKQEQRIKSAVDKKSKNFDKLFKEYDKASAEEKKWRFKVNELKYEMTRISKDLPDAIREFLDDDQRQTYDAMLAARKKPAEASVDASKPVKKRKVIKRKKAKAGGESAAPLPTDIDEEAGQVVVDKAPAADQAAPRKKRALKKKAAPAVQEPVDDIMADEPAGAKPTGKESPAEADEDAGSYP
ncbi:MAG: hypothetical protein WCK75_00545 [Elusimicrobiota bacterium]